MALRLVVHKPVRSGSLLHQTVGADLAPFCLVSEPELTVVETESPGAVSFGFGSTLEPVWWKGLLHVTVINR